MNGPTDPDSASGSRRAIDAARAEQPYESSDDDAAFHLVAPLFTDLRSRDAEPDLASAHAAIIHVFSYLEDHDDALDIGWAAYARNTDHHLREPDSDHLARCIVTGAARLLDRKPASGPRTRSPRRSGEGRRSRPGVRRLLSAPTPARPGRALWVVTEFDLLFPFSLAVQLMQVAVLRSAVTGRLFVGWPNYGPGSAVVEAGPAAAGVCGHGGPGRGQM
jgi:hypothetical protein